MTLNFFSRSKLCWLAIAFCLAASNLPSTQALVAPLNNRRLTPGITTKDRRLTLFSSPETAADTTPPSKAVPPKGINGASPKDASFPSQFSIRLNNALEKMRKISNFASFLCVLDCTILPIITVALPLLGVLNPHAAQLELLHQLGHSLALYFVLPVGSLTTVINYLSHKKTWIASMAVVGLCLVGLANSHIHGQSGSLGSVLHLIQHGPWHRVVSIGGCAMLLGSNYLSQQQGCAFHDHPSEGRDHSHDHGGASVKSCSHDHNHKDHGHEH